MKKVLISVILILGILLFISGGVQAASLAKTSIKLYEMNEYDKLVYPELSIPSNLPQEYKIVVKNATGIPTFSSENTSIAQVDSNGNIIPTTVSCYYMGQGTFKEYMFGTTNILVEVDGQTLKFKVSIVNYLNYYCENKAKEWVNNNLTNNLSSYQKFEKIVKHVAEDYNYSTASSSYYSMMLSGGGDCWASSDAIVKLCNLAGMQAHVKIAVNEPGAGSGHRNAVALVDGDYYVGEAGYNEPKPRYYQIRKLEQGFDHYLYYHGETPEYEIMQYEGNDENVIVPSTINGKNVTRIFAYFCQYSYPTIKSITLPNTIREITTYAFKNSNALESINIPDSVETIGDAPFALSNIKASNVTVGNKYSIKNDALLGNSGKTYIQAFYNDSITEYTIPAGITKINPQAFYVSSVKRVTLPSSLTTINSRAFENSFVQSITIPSTVKTIESKAFSGAALLNTVIIQNGATTIGDNAFEKCANLKILRIPSSVTSIGTNIFNGVNDTSNITIYGVKGSAAETYAKNNNINFIEGTKYELNKTMEVRDTDTFTYNGKSQKPKTEIYFNGTKLVEGTDYTITYNQSTINASDSTNGITYIIKGKGNYTGEFENKYYIKKAYWNFELIVPDVEFGTPVTPQITNDLKYDSLWYRPKGETGYWCSGLPKDLGEYEYEARINADDNHYTTKKTATNKITGTPLESISIIGENIVQIQCSKVLEAVLTPSNASVDKTNIKWTSSDRSIATIGLYTGRVVGIKEGTVTITAQINDKTATFEMTVCKPKIDISTLNVQVAQSNVVYLGRPISRGITIKDGEYTLVRDTDYTVEYKNNVNVGTASIILTGKGNYTGIVTKTFKIIAKDISKLDVQVAQSNVVYLGRPISRGITIKDGNNILVKDTDYTVTYKNNVNPGTASVIITLKGNYTGTVTKTFRIIAPIDISKLDVQVAQSNVVYLGRPISRGITIKDGNKTLVRDTDYTVEYKNNINVGTASVIIRCKGKYAGTVTKTFKIVAKDISKLYVQVAQSNVVCIGRPISRGITIKDGDNILVKDTDYTVTYKDNVYPGIASVIIALKGNYTGTVTKTFRILSTPDISKLNVQVSSSDVVYMGVPISRGIVIKDGNETLVRGKDYIVEYKNNENVGIASVIITGAGKYNGTVTRTFKIVAKDVSTLDVQVAQSDVVYLGRPISRGIMIKDGDKILTRDTDYIVEYKNNVNIGTASVIITCKGNYSGTITKTFRIVAKK